MIRTGKHEMGYSGFGEQGMYDSPFPLLAPVQSRLVYLIS